MNTQDSNNDTNPVSKSNKIDKTFLLYKLIARDLVSNNFKDFKYIYQKYYPETNDEGSETSSTRLLHSVKFRKALEEVLSEVKVKDKVTEEYVLEKLLSIVETTLNDRDRINALVLFGKFLAMWKEQPLQTQVNLYQKYEAELKKIPSPNRNLT